MTRYTARTLLLAALALSALAWLGPGAAQATFPGENGRIAFAHGASDEADIWVMDPDGGSQTNLTCGEVASDVASFSLKAPAWSPDGKTIAFGGRGEDRFGELGFFSTYTMNADGSDRSFLGGGDHPTWSPDGGKIAIAYPGGTRAGLSPEIHVWTADGIRLSSVDPASGPTWSPDGEKIAFEGSDGIRVMNADGSDQALIAVGSGLAWSPDGEKIAFVRSEWPRPSADIWVMNPDGSDQVPLTDGGTRNLVPAWSPDGEKIAFVRTDGAGVRDIWAMNADGSDQTRLIFEGGVSSHLWSPDGQQIAFARGGDIWVMNADGSDQVNLTNTPAWASDPDWQSLPTPGVGPPPSQFCFGALRRNTNTGMARLAVRAPRPGKVVLHRRPGVKRFARVHGAAGPGRVVLRVRPRGRAKRKLARAGRTQRRVRVRVRARVTFRPRAGEPLTKGRRVRLVRVGRR